MYASRVGGGTGLIIPCSTSGVAIGFYSLRPNAVSWHINGTVSSRVDTDSDDNFRPIAGDIRVGSDTPKGSTVPWLTDK